MDIKTPKEESHFTISDDRLLTIDIRLMTPLSHHIHIRHHRDTSVTLLIMK